MRSFKIIGGDLLFDGQTIATMNPRLSASLLDELTQFFDGLTLDVMPIEEADKLAAEARAEGHADGLNEGFDAGYRDGYEVGRRNGAA